LHDDVTASSPDFDKSGGPKDVSQTSWPDKIRAVDPTGISTSIRVMKISP